MIELLQFPFMQRALISGVILGILLACLGVFSTLRRMAFFGEGIAHASLAGIAIALVVGWAPLPVAVVWALLIGGLIYWLEHSTRLSSDTVIGILFTSSMALGVLLMSFTSGYQPELLSFLFGSILSVRSLDIVIIATCTIAILAWLLPSLRALTYTSLNEESARVSGVRVGLHTFLLYASLSVATVLGVKILGIILVSALLIIPPATSLLLTNSFKQHLIASVILTEVAIVGGLLLSLVYDVPSGATIVLVSTLLFFLAMVLKKR
jgi:zinc transport system permease protein